MNALRFELPWPAKVLHPNTKPAHWTGAIGAKRRAREEARLVCRSAATTAGFRVPEGARVRIDIWFVPKTRRKRDKDNLLAACKHYLDGISDAIGVNDYRFDPVPAICEPGPQNVIFTLRVVKPS